MPSVFVVRLSRLLASMGSSLPFFLTFIVPVFLTIACAARAACQSKLLSLAWFILLPSIPIFLWGYQSHTAKSTCAHTTNAKIFYQPHTRSHNSERIIPLLLIREKCTSSIFTTLTVILLRDRERIVSCGLPPVIIFDDIAIEPGSTRNSFI